MTENINKNEIQIDESNRSTNWTLGIASAAAFIITVIYVVKFWGAGLSSNPDSWGQLGDYFGGLLNPIIGGATVYLLFVSISIQRKELSLTRTELATNRDVLKKQSAIVDRQTFEQTFFSWLSNYRNILNSVSYTSERYADRIERYSSKALMASAMTNSPNHETRPITHIRLNGVEALASLWDFEDSCKKTYFDGEASFEPNDIIEEIKHIQDSENELVSSKVCDFYEKLSKCWEYFHSSNSQYIDSLFKNLFGLIIWVESQQNFNNEDKRQYINIILAQLSNLELNILFHYGLFGALSEHRILYEKLAILRDLNQRDIVVEFFLTYQEFLPNHFSFSAFDTDIAFSNKSI